MGKYLQGNSNTPELMYPSAELLQTACYEDYKRLIDTYDKIYEKVNIALVFCGIILIVILSNFDYTIIRRISTTVSNLELFSLLAMLVCSALSAVFVVWAVIELLLMMKSNIITVFDSIAIRNEEIYRKSTEVASVWLIDKYTIATAELRNTVSFKQQKYDNAIVKVIVALLLYAVAAIIQKGA